MKRKHYLKHLYPFWKVKHTIPLHYYDPELKMLLPDWRPFKRKQRTTMKEIRFLFKFKDGIPF